MNRRWLAALALVISVRSAHAPVEIQSLQVIHGQLGPEKIKDLPGWGKVVDVEGDCEFKGGEDKLTIVVPGTLLTSHRNLIRRNHTGSACRTPDRPATRQEIASVDGRFRNFEHNAMEIGEFFYTKYA